MSNPETFIKLLKHFFFYVQYLQSSISCFKLSTCLFNSLFSSLQCTLMYFVGGNEDFGVFIPTCGRTSCDGSRGNGSRGMTSESDSPLLDSSLLLDEAMTRSGLWSSAFLRGVVIEATSCAQLCICASVWAFFAMIKQNNSMEGYQWTDSIVNFKCPYDQI